MIRDSATRSNPLSAAGQLGTNDLLHRNGGPDILGSALNYAHKGWAIIPIMRGSKNPNRRNWSDLRLSADQVHAEFAGKPKNIGVLLGEPSGHLVDVDLDSDEARELAAIFLPQTDAAFGRATTGVTHMLYICSPSNETTKYTDPDDRSMILELRSTGCQTLFPPSEHPSRELIEWMGAGEPAHVHADDLLCRVGKLAAAALLARHWREGTRHDAALALAGGLHRAGWDLESITTFAGAVASAANDDEVADRVNAVETTVERLRDEEPSTGWPTLADLLGEPTVTKVREWLGITESVSLPPLGDERCESFALTDLGNAERLVARHGHDLRYCHRWNKWMVWDGRRWQIDDTGEVMRRAKDAAKGIYCEAADAGDKTEARELATWAHRSQAEARLRAMVRLAQSEPRIAIVPDALDTDPFLLTVRNGTLDLRTGVLRPHKRNDLITKLAPVRYDGDAGCPTWDTFLSEITSGDRELITFLQRAAGYALTGDTREQVVFIAYGSGANGKSTFINHVLTMMGDYGKQTPSSTLTTRRSAIPNDVAALHGARLAAAVETDEGQRLSEALIKQLSGGDRVSARFMRGEWFEFEPQFKVWLSTNHKPAIRGSDHGIWRRIRMIPFVVTIPDDRQDKALPEKLQAESSGILRWAVDGCLAWQRDGLGLPASVKTATNEYRSEMDAIEQFIEDRCVTGRVYHATAADLYLEYQRWCVDNGEYTASKRKFGTRLAERGFKKGRGSGGIRKWDGIGLLDVDRSKRDTSDASEAPIPLSRQHPRVA